MVVGRRQYNEAEMMQMQRDAEMRVREMHSRARKTVENNPQNNRTPRQGQNGNRPSMQNMQREMRHPHPPQPDALPEVPAPCQEDCPAPKDGTIVGDILDALHLDEDVLLILGLILILLNQRADTTLILALAYLLI